MDKVQGVAKNKGSCLDTGVCVCGRGKVWVVVKEAKRGGGRVGVGKERCYFPGNVITCKARSNGGVCVRDICRCG